MCFFPFGHLSMRAQFNSMRMLKAVPRHVIVSTFHNGACKIETGVPRGTNATCLRGEIEQACET